MIKCRIIPVQDNILQHSVVQDFTDLFVQNPELMTIQAQTGGLCCYQKKDPDNMRDKNLIILYQHPEAGYLYQLDTTLDEALLFFTEHMLVNQKISLKIAFQLISIAMKLNLSHPHLFKLFHLVHWQSSLKGLDYYQALTSFTPLLKNQVLDQSIPLPEAYLFYRTFKDQSDLVISLFPTRATFTEKGLFCRYLAEIAVKNGFCGAELVSRLNGEQSQDFMSLIFQYRYPLFQKTTQHYTAFCTQLPLPAGVKLTHDTYFENPSQQLIFNFSSSKQLVHQLHLVEERLTQLMQRADYKDYFDLDVLLGDIGD